MTVEIIPEPSFEDALHVCRNMRQRDRDEIFALRWDEAPESVAADTVRSGPFRWGAYLDGEPVALIGAYPRWPRVWTAWCFGTDKWPRVTRSLTRHALRFMQPAIRNSGAVRMDCWSLDGHKDAEAWLRLLGAKAETSLDNYGKNGEKFVCYSWTRNEQTGHSTDVR